jgi:hypothetical protein
VRHLKTNISTLSFDDDDYLEIIMSESAVLDLANVINHFETTREFTNYKKVGCVLDLKAIKFNHIPKEVMSYLANSKYNQYQLGVAIIIEGLGQKILGNFYLKVHKPKVQTKLFTNYNEAKVWLTKIKMSEKVNEIL